MMLRFDDLCLLNISCCADFFGPTKHDNEINVNDDEADDDDYEDDDSFLRMYISVCITSATSSLVHVP